jgi:hypothetical protein
MADTYIRLDHADGTLKETEATDTSTGAADAGDIVALDATGRIDLSMMPVGIGADTQALTASESLAAGDFVNVWNNAGTPSVRKADATTAGKHAHGYVLASAALGATATVYFDGINTQAAGLVVGDLFLSTTPGLATATPPAASGNVVQRLGAATSGTSANFEASAPVVLA